MRGTRLLLRLVNEIGATQLLRDSGCLNQIASAHQAFASTTLSSTSEVANELSQLAQDYEP